MPTCISSGPTRSRRGSHLSLTPLTHVYFGQPPEAASRQLLHFADLVLLQVEVLELVQLGFGEEGDVGEVVSGWVGGGLPRERTLRLGVLQKSR